MNFSCSTKSLTIHVPFEKLGILPAPLGAECDVDEHGPRDTYPGPMFQRVLLSDATGDPYLSYICFNCLTKAIEASIEEELVFGDGDPGMLGLEHGQECEAFYPSRDCQEVTSLECFACGVPICKNCLVQVAEYYEYGPKDICFACLEEHYPQLATDAVESGLFTT